MKHKDLFLTIVLFAITLSVFAQTQVSQTSVTLLESVTTMNESSLIGLNVATNGTGYSG